jgi:RNA polymerase sigma-70 factor (ECF subfamily)
MDDPRLNGYPGADGTTPVLREVSLRGQIDEAVRAARASWPDLHVDEATFVTWLSRCPAPGSSLAASLPSLHLADLWLACACAAGDRHAHEELDRRLRAAVPSAAARMRASSSFIEEVQQRLRQKLLVGGPDGQPKICAYVARGPLSSWLRAAALREALNLLEGERDDATLDGVALGRLPASGSDPELDLVRRRYAPEFKSALDEALRGLPPKERNLLRLYFVQGLTVEEIGRMEGTHKSTISRWLARTRASVLAEVRRRLGQSLRLSPRELDSLIGVLRSQLHLSLHRALEP